MLAGGDLLLNVAMDATMVVGVGEGLKAAYVGAKAAAHVGEELGAHLVEHAGEDAAEHVAEHEAEDGVAEAAADCLSFAAATLVATPSGEKAIASLKPGEKVQAYDPATGTRSTQTVAATSVHRDANLVDVTLRVVVPAVPAVPAVPSKAATAAKTTQKATGTTHTSTAATTARTRDETIQTTTNHPWLTADHGWLPAGFLHLGEPVQELDGAVAVVVSVKAVVGTAPMYDLSLDAVHTFAVGDGQFVVHNANCGDVRVQHVVDNMDTLAPEAKVDPIEILDPNDRGIHYGEGRYQPDISTGNSLFEVTGPGKLKKIKAAETQMYRLSRAAKYVGKTAYYAWDATETALPDQLRRLAGRWEMRVIEFMMR